MTTNTLLTPADIAAIRGRCEAATPGPWYHIDPDAVRFHAVGGWLRNCPDGSHWIETLRIGKNRAAVAATPLRMPAENATFIAHARTDIPRLLAHVAALEANMERWREWADGFSFLRDSDDDLSDLIMTPQPTQEPQP